MKRCGPWHSPANPAIAAARNRPNPHSQMGQMKAFHLSSLCRASNAGVALCSRGVQDLSYKLKNIVFKRIPAKTTDYVVFEAALLLTLPLKSGYMVTSIFPALFQMC